MEGAEAVLTKAMIAALIGLGRVSQRRASRAKSGYFVVKSAKQDAKTLVLSRGAASDGDEVSELTTTSA